jgi:XRE family transcriptional regulator of biofilm formation
MLSLGKAIKLIRSARGEPLGSVAERAKVGIPFLSLVEAGQRQPSIATLRRISDALEIPPEVLILLGVEKHGSSLRSEDEAVASLTTALEKVARAEAELKTRLKAGN